jgi:hypothetical protein
MLLKSNYGPIIRQVFAGKTYYPTNQKNAHKSSLESSLIGQNTQSNVSPLLKECVLGTRMLLSLAVCGSDSVLTSL